VFVWSGGVGAVFVALGLAGHVGKGFEWRINDAERQLYATSIPSPMRNRCHYDRNSSFDALDSCEYFGESPDVAVYGNSHGVELAYAIAEELQKNSRSLIHFTISGCLPGFRREIEEYCSTFYDDRLRYLLENDGIRYVALTYRAEEGDADVSASIVALANYLIASGKGVVLVVQAPTLERGISTYRLGADEMLEGDIHARSRAEWSAINANFYASLQDLNSDVAIVDLADYFCDADVCFAALDGQALYFDNNHMSVFGARRAASAIVELFD
jgi:hypothetical protein